MPEIIKCQQLNEANKYIILENSIFEELEELVIMYIVYIVAKNDLNNAIHEKLVQISN